MASVAAIGLPMREDEVTDGDCRDAILGNAPRSAPAAAKGLFRRAEGGRVRRPSECA